MLSGDCPNNFTCENQVVCSFSANGILQNHLKLTFCSFTVYLGYYKKKVSSKSGPQLTAGKEVSDNVLKHAIKDNPFKGLGHA